MNYRSTDMRRAADQQHLKGECEMPDYFWKWYKKKGYEQILSIDLCFENKAFLIGCCIEYLTEKGQKITALGEYSNIDDIINYLSTGVAWTS